MKTIVVIDNDSLTRALLAECLAGQGWRVIEAEDGEAGLDLVVKYRPAAVLCDIRTPKRNGFHVCRSIRDQEQLRPTHVILTSVSRFGNDRDTAFEAEADEYLVKPILPSELTRTLADCLAKQSSESSASSAAASPPAGPTRLRFWGVRGSIPTPGHATAGVGGNTACVEVRVGDQIIILDAGSGLRNLGQALLQEFKEAPLNVTLLITHTHWDHIQGFPFFMPAYVPRVNVRILGYEGAVHGLRGALFEQMTSAFFPVGLNQMASRVTFEELNDMQFQLGPVKVTAIFANHPGICLAYRLSTPEGDIVFMPDHEAYERHEIERQKNLGETSTSSLEYARQQDAKIIDFIRGADVLIADAQYDPAEYPARLGWGHTCADDTVDYGIRAGVKHLFLFHHDPDHTDEKIATMVKRAEDRVKEAASPMLVEAAREGTELVLGER